MYEACASSSPHATPPGSCPCGIRGPCSLLPNGMYAPFVHSAAWASAQATATGIGLGKLLRQHWLGLCGFFWVGVDGGTREKCSPLPVKNTPPCRVPNACECGAGVAALPATKAHHDHPPHYGIHSSPSQSRPRSPRCVQRPPTERRTAQTRKSDRTLAGYGFVKRPMKSSSKACHSVLPTTKI